MRVGGRGWVRGRESGRSPRQESLGQAKFVALPIELKQQGAASGTEKGEPRRHAALGFGLNLVIPVLDAKNPRHREPVRQVQTQRHVLHPEIAEIPCGAGQSLNAGSLRLAMSESTAIGTVESVATPLFRRVPEPEGGSNTSIVPGVGRNPRAGSSALMRNSMA